MFKIETFFIAVVFALLVQPVVAEDKQEGMRFSHLDWSLICDNTRTCSAVGSRGLQDWLHHDAAVLLSRKAGPGEPIQARARFVSWNAAQPQVVRMHINQEDLGVLDGPDSNGDYQLSASQVQSLLPVLVGRYGGVVFKSSGWEWPLSVTGAAAVFLKMDEVQGRIDTPGDVMRKGNRPEQSVLPLALAPVVKRVDFVPRRHGDSSLAFAPDFRKELFAKPEASFCIPYKKGLIFSTEQISKDKVLVLLQCNYGNFKYWVANDTPPYDPQLVTNNGVSHDRNGEILAKQNASKTGDCAVSERWTWDGVSFVRTSMLTSGKCVAQNDAGKWQIPIFVTRVVP
ncbi:DUF1176 domain-containing protein [Pseudomonas azerbaijanorientalis]|uniref:DUF1176 domain-containing protein n=1 Tax=Pseudomonas azerbaijanorientalis TaxID=2842350 RepID=UPI001C3CCDFA|nr:DUF1176 domain-containing protein [Pseudomonas azerbaijanorientalis]QXH60326.1 DUF1176 domain-containing protein [Pseudomonas azerbaijanorientalis]